MWMVGTSPAMTIKLVAYARYLGPINMLLELWIMLAVVAVGAIGIVTVRLKRRREREAAAQSGTESNVYPLW